MRSTPVCFKVTTAIPAILLLAAACGLVACSMAPRRTAAEQAADAQIADRVQAVLLADLMSMRVT